jgi:Beta-galactosidase
MPLELAVCDYPEQVPPEEWAVFPKKMRELGLSYVRIGEFAWSKLEPRAWCLLRNLEPRKTPPMNDRV